MESYCERIVAVILFVLGTGLSEGESTFSDTPLVVWSQQAHLWSKLRGFSTNMEHWDEYLGISYVQSDSIWDSHRYALSYDSLNDVLMWSDQNTGYIYEQPRAAGLNYSREHITPRLQGLKEENHNNGASSSSSSSSSPLIIHGMAHDWLTGATYFTEGTHGLIGVLSGNRDRQGEGGDIEYEILYDSIVNDPHGIAVDPIEGVLFWTETVVPRIMAAPSYSGGLAHPLLTYDLDVPMGITVDTSSKRLYWVDRGRRRVEAVSYDGTGREILFQKLDEENLFGITMHEEFLYVTSVESLHLYIIHIATKSLRHQLDVDAFAYDIVTIAPPPSTQKHECASLSCQHLCVNKGSYQGACICHQGYFINPDGKTCTKQKSQPKYLYSIGSTIYMVNVTLDLSDDLVTHSNRVPVVEQENEDAPEFVSLAVYSSEHLLYFSDTRAIYWEQVNTAESEWKTHTEITVQTGDVQGIAIDWLTPALYWADHGLKHIMSAQLDGRYHTMVLRDLAEGPRGLAVDAGEGQLWWTTDTELYVARMDGSKVQRVMEGMYAAQSVAVDCRTHRVYVTDTASSEIHSISSWGEDHRVYDMAAGMYGITLFKNLLTWTKDNMGLQHSRLGDIALDYTPSNTSEFPLINEHHGTKFYDVVTYGDYMQPDVTVSSCVDDVCQQLCFPLGPADHACGCAIGFTLAADGKTCNTDKLSYSSFLLFVDPYHKQVYHLPMNGNPSSMATSKVHAVEGGISSASAYPLSAAFIGSTGMLYWVDQGLGAVMETDMETQQHRVIWRYGEDSHPFKLVGKPGRLYFLDEVKSSIQWLSTTENTEHGILVEGLVKPHALVMDALQGLLYWSSLSAEGQGQIEVIREDGSARRVLADNMGDVSGLHLHTDAHRLYFCDRLLHNVGYLDLNITEPSVEVIMEAPGTQFSGIAVSNDEQDIFFTVWNEKGISRIRNNVVEQLVDPIFARITDLKLYDGAYAEAITGGPETPLVPILSALGALALLGLLLFCIICAVFKRPRKHSSKDTTSSNEPIHDELDNEVEWAEFNNPSMYDIRSSGENALSENRLSVFGQVNDIQPVEGYETPVSARNSMVEGKGPSEMRNSMVEGRGPSEIRNSMVEGDLGEGSSESVNTNSPTGSQKSTRALTGAAVTPLAAIAQRPGHIFKKRTTKRASAKPRQDKLQPNTFDLADNNKVATVIQRIVGRMRNKLSSVKWSESDSKYQQQQQQQQQPDITLNMPIATTDASLMPDKSLKVSPGKRLVYIPPKLHDPPRGWAPASHNVPMGGIRSSWGKAKHMQALGGAGMK